MKRRKLLFNQTRFIIVALVAGSLVGIIYTGNKDSQIADEVPSPPSITSSAERLTSFSPSPEAQMPEYEITEERMDDSGIWHVTLGTLTVNQQELKKLVQHACSIALTKSQIVNSVFVDVVQNDNSSSKLATGKMALTSTGEAQTGSKKLEVSFQLNR
ncbi:hypothetical protein BBD42_26920 [Paenibacillus sp. BIHB 4019]|uniref:Uncharacterized protein n=1 Tax=Paenibacillus sp. BIHB 4019 TaxID=1870819 RepID=A0A1B2DPT1_9BACL|nr:hypothetical protein [Paenibacillus sp. BIHB 4019]ANY69717.1 hypothetical protein BBD42_26920 [Paenibacillus sp. BIHB 4019]